MRLKRDAVKRILTKHREEKTRTKRGRKLLETIGEAGEKLLSGRELKRREKP